MNEKTFNFRFSLSAIIPPELLDDDEFDENAWLQEWETTLKPRLIRHLFAELRTFKDWDARVRNRGISPEDEIEVVVTRTYGVSKKTLLQ